MIDDRAHGAPVRRSETRAGVWLALLVSMVVRIDLSPCGAVAQPSVPTPATMVVGPAADIVAASDEVVLAPGTDINAVVRRLPPGTKFFLSAGIFRTQQIFPKNGDSFTGAPGATLNGARLLTTFDVSQGLYVARNQRPHPKAETIGFCRTEFPRCNRPQDLYINGRPLRAVSRLSDVGPGKWFFDYRNNSVHFHDSPEGQTVELSFTPFAFGGPARDVNIRNLVVENYASADRQGAIHNHGAGTS